MMCFVHVLFASLMMSAVGGRQADVARQNRAADQHKYAGYGYQPGTQGYADCIARDTRREIRPRTTTGVTQ